MTMKWVADTNFIYEGLQETFGQYNIVLTSTVKQELDKHKTVDSKELQFKARQANRFIFKNYDDFTHVTAEFNPEDILGKEYSKEIMDNRIVATAKSLGYGILTNDLNMFSTAKDFGIEVKSYNESDKNIEDEYTGFKHIQVSKEELVDFHVNNLGRNIYGLHINQYLILEYNEEKEVFVWNGKFHEKVRDNLIFRSSEIGDFKPYDEYQLIAMDSIIRNDFTILKGKAGTAKTLTALTYAMQEIGDSGRTFDRITIITNNMPAKDAFYNGWVKGTLLEKLMDSTIGNMLSSKMGSKDKVIDMVLSGSLEIIPLSDIRGWEPSANSIVVMSEAQNYNVYSMQLALQRIPTSCKIIVEGDNKAQVDDKSFEGLNNGMRRAIEVFKGFDYFGTVELQNIYRSEIAKQAEKMTEWDY